ncbi:MAG: DNA-binding protein [Ramlibacter sp.]|nr:DNA-binding protein [Ramlibacter sp.]
MMVQEGAPSMRLTPAQPGAVWVARLRPYEDLVASLHAFCIDNGLRRIHVLGCVGSLMHGTVLRPDGTTIRIEGPGVEILSAAGWLDAENPEQSFLALTLGDRAGGVQAGQAAQSGNPVCVTAELMLQEWQ